MSPKFCWVVANLSYYHHARLQAFAKRYSGSAIVFNVSDTSGFREFEFQAAGNRRAYDVETLFNGVYFGDVSPSQLRRVLWNRLDAARPSVVGVQGWSHKYALLTLQWALRRRVPRIVFSESQRIDFSRRGWREAVKRRIIRHFQAGVVGGRVHADYLFELGMPANQIFSGYDVVDNDYFAAAADAARRAPRPSEMPTSYFLASCRFIPKKNLVGLVNAYAEYRRLAGNSAWDLIVLGDGDERGAIEQLCSTLGIVDSVLLPGFQSYQELPKYYAWAGAFILPSLREQWGLVVNEAMASGLPVLVSDRCGCASELVEAGKNGFTFPPEDCHRLAELMLQISTSDQRTDFGRRSREIIACWSPQRFADGLSHAVDVATAAPVTRAGLADRAIIRTLSAMKAVRSAAPE